jgi:hypothetical protein
MLFEVIYNFTSESNTIIPPQGTSTTLQRFWDIGTIHYSFFMCQYIDRADSLPARSKEFYTEEAHWIKPRLSDNYTCQKLQRLFSLVQRPEYLIQYSPSLRAERSFVRTLVRIIFSTFVQIGAKAHPAFYKMRPSGGEGRVQGGGVWRWPNPF